MITGKRFFYHFLFWFLSVAFLSAFLGKGSGRTLDTFVLVILLLPVAMVTTYTFNYYLFPNYLFKKHYYRFALYSFLLVTVSIYTQMLVVLGSFVFGANYNIEEMIPGSTNAINLGVGMYFVVFLSTLIYLVKRWSEPAKEEDAYLVVRSERKQVRINLDDLYYIESLDNYVKINTREKEVLTKEKISELETRLNGKFLRIHRSYLVNKRHIESYTREWVLVNGKELPISRTYKKDVMDKLKVRV